MADSESDADLLTAWQGGDKAAGNALFRRYFTAVRRFFANKVAASDVEDLIQRTFMGCVESTGRFRGDASFRTFLFAIARRQLYKHLRDRASKNSKRDFDAGVSSIHALGHSPSSIAAKHEQHALLLEALRRVSVEHQTMLELHYWEQLPGPEIAAVFDISPTTVRTRLHRARRAMEAVLSEIVGAPDGEAPELDIDEVARALGRQV